MRGMIFILIGTILCQWAHTHGYTIWLFCWKTFINLLFVPSKINLRMQPCVFCGLQAKQTKCIWCFFTTPNKKRVFFSQTLVEIKWLLFLCKVFKFELAYHYHVQSIRSYCSTHTNACVGTYRQQLCAKLISFVVKMSRCSIKLNSGCKGEKRIEKMWSVLKLLFFVC